MLPAHRHAAGQLSRAALRVFDIVIKNLQTAAAHVDLRDRSILDAPPIGKRRLGDVHDHHFAAPVDLWNLDAALSAQAVPLQKVNEIRLVIEHEGVATGGGEVAVEVAADPEIA